MLTQAIIRDRINHFPGRCKNAGLKVTHQRTAVYGMLAATESHPTPEEVYSQIRQNLPTVSLATVYKILDLFHKYGFLRKVSTEGQVARYDANVDPHHHVICTQCGTIKDIVQESEARIALTQPEVSDFAITHCDVIYHGLCKGCQSRSRQKKA